MTSTTVDQRYGLSSGVAVKAPVRLATTANITLSGEQTIDGVAAVAGDRVLVKDQSSGLENGIYTVSTGNWVRSADFDGNRDVVTGMRTWVTAGSVNANNEFFVTTSGPIVIDTTSITWQSYIAISAAAPSTADYLVKTANAGLSAERVVTDTISVTWDFTTPAQAKANVTTATSTVAGIVELATTTEASSGQSTTLAVTPAGLAAGIAATNPALPPGFIYGVTTANSTGDITNDISFASGYCRDQLNTQNMTCAAMIKQLDATWTAGTNQGMRSSSALTTGLQTWHLFSIAKTDNTQDFLAHDALDPTSVLPSGYSKYRWVWAAVRFGNAIYPYTQYDDECQWRLRAGDLNTPTASTSKTNLTLTVPTGVPVKAMLSLSAASTTAMSVIFYNAGDSDDTPAITKSDFSAASSYTQGANVERWTDTAANVAYEASASADLRAQTRGWKVPGRRV